jgi:hypothetical protein
MESAGMTDRLEKGIDAGQVVFLGSERAQATDGIPLSKSIEDELARLCPPKQGTGVRFQVNVSRLFALMSPGEADAILVNLASRCRATRSVVLGAVSPHSAPAEQLAKLRAAADGIVRVWSEGSYSFLEVVKTVNSARTPVYAIRQTPQPPFIEIME